MEVIQLKPEKIDELNKKIASFQDFIDRAPLDKGVALAMALQGKSIKIQKALNSENHDEATGLAEDLYCLYLIMVHMMCENKE